MLKEPFFGHFFSGLAKLVTDTTPGICTRPEGYIMQLLVNPTFWEEALPTPLLRFGALKHELLHLVFKHPLRLPDFPNTEIYNVAADLVVNQYLLPEQLQEDSILLSHFEGLALEPEQDLTYYYDKLLGLQKQQEVKGKEDEEKEEEEQGENQPNSDPNDSEDSSDTNEKQAGEGEPGSEAADGSSGAQSLDQFLDPSHPAQETHGEWEKMKAMPQAERDILDQTLTDALLNSLERTERNQAEGELPAGFLEQIRSYRSRYQSTLDWRNVLKLFLASSTRTSIKNTLKRPSKRYGTTPGIKIRRKKKLMVALDTSGSIAQEDLLEFFNELYYVWKQGAEITVVECDVEIQKVWEYKGQSPASIQGRGGTGFDAPLKYANERIRPDAILYFTDGFGEIPKVTSRAPILWLITSMGLSEGEEKWEGLPGRKVKLVRNK